MLNSQSVLRNDVTSYCLARWVWDLFWIEFVFFFIVLAHWSLLGKLAGGRSRNRLCIICGQWKRVARLEVGTRDGTRPRWRLNKVRRRSEIQIGPTGRNNGRPLTLFFFFTNYGHRYVEPKERVTHSLEFWKDSYSNVNEKTTNERTRTSTSESVDFN